MSERFGSLDGQTLRFGLSSDDKEGSAELIPRRSKEGVRVALYGTLLLADSLSIIAGFLVGNIARFFDPFATPGLNYIALVLPLYVIFAFSGRTYSLQVLQQTQLSVVRGVKALAITSAALLLILFSAKASAELSRLVFGIGALSSAVLLALARYLLGRFAGRRHDWNFVSEVLIIDGVTAQPRRGQIVMFSDLAGMSPLANDPENFTRIGRLLVDCDRILLACRPNARLAWAEALKGVGVPVEILTPELDYLGALELRRAGDQSAILIAPGPLGLRDRVMKRALDIFVAGPTLLLLSPLLVVVAVAVKLTSSGPVFFRQPRLGQGNRVFDVLKFRTMRFEAGDTHGAQSTAKHDNRITPIGRWLRRTSMDELPQLLNVLKGEMSMVGPRPHALGSTADDLLFWNIDPRYWQRGAVKPGITGLAQVRGFRGATERQEDLTNRLRADLEYLSRWSLWKDLVIMFKTMKVLVHPNAY